MALAIYFKAKVCKGWLLYVFAAKEDRIQATNPHRHQLVLCRLSDGLEANPLRLPSVMIIATYWYKSPIAVIRSGSEIEISNIIQQVVIMACFWLIIEISQALQQNCVANPPFKGALNGYFASYF
ncbi:hypothetical protein [Shewanella algae]|uniref:hypothetical protein n=1 Tax=Shewanella algae TaxID=38313 RepID=UPI001AAE09F1|nr:hypothetical protein [Shewanella algae]MBO2599002.1 hypothetical protein [Shewanella algae]